MRSEPGAGVSRSASAPRPARRPQLRARTGTATPTGSLDYVARRRLRPRRPSSAELFERLDAERRRQPRRLRLGDGRGPRRGKLVCSASNRVTAPSAHGQSSGSELSGRAARTPLLYVPGLDAVEADQQIAAAGSRAPRRAALARQSGRARPSALAGRRVHDGQPVGSCPPKVTEAMQRVLSALATQLEAGDRPRISTTDGGACPSRST